MFIAYRISIGLVGNDQNIIPHAHLWKVRILKMSNLTVTVDDFGSSIRVKKEDIFESEEDARSELESRKNDLIAAIRSNINKFQEEKTRLQDRTSIKSFDDSFDS